MATRYRHADILARLEADDDALTALEFLVGDDGTDYARLGDAIGGNTHLQALEIDLPRGGRPPGQALFEGLGRNSSVRRLTLNRGSRADGDDIYVKILEAFAVRSESLTKLTMTHCVRGNPVAFDALASAVGGSADLGSITIRHTHIGEELPHLEKFVGAVAGLRRLEELNLGYNGVGDEACEVLASLLRDEGCALRTLNLEHNEIGSGGLALLANSLTGNKTLECLDLKGNPGMALGRGWEVFSKVICDTSSIEATHSSNHALRSLGVHGGVLPTGLFCILTLNHSPDKARVAMKKILWKHPRFDMVPFFEWDMKMLPVVLGWFERARMTNGTSEARLEAHVLSAIYQFVHVMPEVFEPAPQKGQKGKGKRRRSKGNELR